MAHQSSMHSTKEQLGWAGWALAVSRRNTASSSAPTRRQPQNGCRTVWRLLHLAEDLRLAQHHRIEAAGDAEHVAHGVAAGQGVQVGGDFLRLQPVVFRQPLRRRLGRLGGAIQFGAVAGRQDRRLAHLVAMRQLDQRLRQAHRVERHLFAHGKRRGMVVEAEGE